MTQAISIRLNQRDLDYVKRKTKAEKISKSTVLKELVSLGVKEDKRNLAISEYQKGATLREAAEIAELTPREMIDFLISEGIKFGGLKQEISVQVKKLR